MPNTAPRAANGDHASGRRRILETPTHGDILDAVAGLHAEITAIKESIGGEGEDEYGKPIGRGVVGRLMRIERRIGRYDGWIRWATGAAAAAAFFGSVLWWAWEAKLKAVIG